MTVERTEADFLTEIYAAPLDDNLRDAFGAWLTARQDPRGRFVVLQMIRKRGGVDPAGVKEERALLAKHALAWLGPLEPVVDHARARFEGGFLFSCRVKWRALAAAPALMTNPAWATVRDYELPSDGEKACDRWLDHMIALGAKRR